MQRNICRTRERCQVKCVNLGLVARHDAALPEPSVGAEIPLVAGSTFSRRSQGHLLWGCCRSPARASRLRELPALPAADCSISPSGGCSFAPCLLSSLKVEFCYSSALCFSSKDCCEGELGGSTRLRSSCIRNSCAERHWWCWWYCWLGQGNPIPNFFNEAQLSCSEAKILLVYPTGKLK